MTRYAKMQRVLAVMLVASFLLAVAAFALPAPAAAYCLPQQTVLDIMGTEGRLRQHHLPTGLAPEACLGGGLLLAMHWHKSHLPNLPLV